MAGFLPKQDLLSTLVDGQSNLNEDFWKQYWDTNFSHHSSLIKSLPLTIIWSINHYSPNQDEKTYQTYQQLVLDYYRYTIISYDREVNRIIFDINLDHTIGDFYNQSRYLTPNKVSDLEAICKVAGYLNRAVLINKFITLVSTIELQTDKAYSNIEAIRIHLKETILSGALYGYTLAKNWQMCKVIIPMLTNSNYGRGSDNSDSRFIDKSVMIANNPGLRTCFPVMRCRHISYLIFAKYHQWDLCEMIKNDIKDYWDETDTDAHYYLYELDELAQSNNLEAITYIASQKSSNPSIFGPPGTITEDYTDIAQRMLEAVIQLKEDKYPHKSKLLDELKQRGFEDKLEEVESLICK